MTIWDTATILDISDALVWCFVANVAAPVVVVVVVVVFVVVVVVVYWYYHNP